MIAHTPVKCYILLLKTTFSECWGKSWPWPCLPQAPVCSQSSHLHINEAQANPALQSMAVLLTVDTVLSDRLARARWVGLSRVVARANRFQIRAATQPANQRLCSWLFGTTAADRSTDSTPWTQSHLQPSLHSTTTTTKEATFKQLFICAGGLALMSCLASSYLLIYRLYFVFSVAFQGCCIDCKHMPHLNVTLIRQRFHQVTEWKPIFLFLSPLFSVFLLS